MSFSRDFLSPRSEREVVVEPGQSYGPYGHRITLPGGERGLRFSLDQIAQKAWEGRAHRATRSWNSHVLRDAAVGWDATVKSRAATLLRAVQQRLVWLPDARHVEQIPGAHVLFSDELAGEDCFPEGMLVHARLEDGAETIVPVQDLRVGMHVWGLDRWSLVKDVWSKGERTMDVVRLGNGSEFPLTPEHHVYVLDCPKHPMLDDKTEAWALAFPSVGAPCRCDRSLRVEKRTSVSQLRIGMVLPEPQRVRTPFLERDRPKHLPSTTVSYIRRADVRLPCWDITTDDHRVYLPEHDVTVSQCDGKTVAGIASILQHFGAALEGVSIPTAVCAVAYDYVDEDGKEYEEPGPGRVPANLSHVLFKLFIDGKWLYADPSTNDPLGTPSGLGHITRELLVSVDPSRQTLCDASACPIDLKPPSLDELPGTFQTFDGPKDTMSHDAFFHELGEAFGSAPPSSWNTDTAAAALAELKSDADRLNAAYDQNDATNFPGPFLADGTRNPKYDDWRIAYAAWKDEYARVLDFANGSPGFTMYADVQAKRQELLDWQATLQTYGGHVAGPPLSPPDKDTSSNPATLGDAIGSIFTKAIVATLVVGGVILAVKLLPPLLEPLLKPASDHHPKAA